MTEVPGGGGRPGRAADCCPAGARLCFPGGPLPSALCRAHLCLHRGQRLTDGSSRPRRRPHVMRNVSSSPAPRSFLSPLAGLGHGEILYAHVSVRRCSEWLLSISLRPPVHCVACSQPLRSLAFACSRSVCKRLAFSSCKSNSNFGLLWILRLP